MSGQSSPSELNSKLQDLSLYNNRRVINPAVQAKLLAFQEKRKQQLSQPQQEQPQQQQQLPQSQLPPLPQTVSQSSSSQQLLQQQHPYDLSQHSSNSNSVISINETNPLSSPFSESQVSLSAASNIIPRKNEERDDDDDVVLNASSSLPGEGIIRRTSFRLPKQGSSNSSGTNASSARLGDYLASLDHSNQSQTQSQFQFQSQSQQQSPLLMNSSSSPGSSFSNTPVSSTVSTPVDVPQKNFPDDDYSISTPVNTTNRQFSLPITPLANQLENNNNLNASTSQVENRNSTVVPSVSDKPIIPTLPNTSKPVTEGLPKRSTLSQRRGMKLDINSLMNNNNNSTAPDRPPASKFNPLANSNAMTQKRGATGAPSSAKMDRLRQNVLPQRGSNKSGAATGVGSANDKPNSLNLNMNMTPGGMFANYSKYVDIKSGSLNFKGKASLHSRGVDFTNGSSFRISHDDLEFQDELGRGNYGIVSKVLHKPTGIIMAMKEVRLELDDSKFRQILMELEILHNCNSDCIVEFYGAFFVEGAVYMCIEYMQGGSLDKIYFDGVPEEELAYITKRVVTGLQELKDKHNIIHRDVKPTNILVNEVGKVKLCDFGVSGNLVASLARTNIGCQSYMAPERIKSNSPDVATYTVASDIWSLGLSLLEIANGCYPYPPETYDNIFSQLSAIVDGDPPSLPADTFSEEARDFVRQCLNKVPSKRPHYAELLKHPWLLKYPNEERGQQLMCDLVKTRSETLKNNKLNKVNKKVPALHKKQINT